MSVEHITDRQSIAAATTCHHGKGTFHVALYMFARIASMNAAMSDLSFLIYIPYSFSSYFSPLFLNVLSYLSCSCLTSASLHISAILSLSFCRTFIYSNFYLLSILFDFSFYHRAKLFLLFANFL